MKRELVSPEELLKWMNSQLAMHDEYTDCRFTSVLPLREEDEDGCKWSGANLPNAFVMVKIEKGQFKMID